MADGQKRFRVVGSDGERTGAAEPDLGTLSFEERLAWARAARARAQEERAGTGASDDDPAFEAALKAALRAKLGADENTAAPGTNARMAEAQTVLPARYQTPPAAASTDIKAGGVRLRRARLSVAAAKKPRVKLAIRKSTKPTGRGARAQQPAELGAVGASDRVVLEGAPVAPAPQEKPARTRAWLANAAGLALVLVAILAVLAFAFRGVLTLEPAAETSRPTDTPAEAEATAAALPGPAEPALTRSLAPGLEPRQGQRLSATESVVLNAAPAALIAINRARAPSAAVPNALGRFARVDRRVLASSRGPRMAAQWPPTERRAEAGGASAIPPILIASLGPAVPGAAIAAPTPPPAFPAAQIPRDHPSLSAARSDSALYFRLVEHSPRPRLRFLPPDQRDTAFEPEIRPTVPEYVPPPRPEDDAGAR